MHRTDSRHMRAQITHPGVKFMSGVFGQKRTRVHGHIARVAPGQQPLDAFSDSARVRKAAGAQLLAAFDGDFDGVVEMHPASSSSFSGDAHAAKRAAVVIWDARVEAALEASAPPAMHTPELEARPTESVWGSVFSAMAEQAWDVARQRKEAVENAERRARKAREKAGRTWTPHWFIRDEAGRWLPRP